MNRILLGLALVATIGCGSTDNQYQSPYTRSMTVGSSGGSGDFREKKAYDRDDMQESADRINRRHR